MTTSAGKSSLTPLVSGMAAALGLACLVVWQTRDHTTDITRRAPGMDHQPGQRSSGNTAEAGAASFFVQGQAEPGGPDGAWPRFRGSHFDNTVHTTTGTRLSKDWETTPPEALWSVTLGEGHAAPAVLDGRVFVLDYDETRQADTLRCLSLATGGEIWRRGYTVPMKRNHGLSRTIPAVTREFVVTIGPRCHVMCVDTRSGDFLWSIDLQAEYGTKEPFWYAGQCPLIDDGVAVIAPAGPEVLMMGVDCATGEVLWKTPNPNAWKMSHSSIMPMTLNGVKMYVYSAVGGVAGIAAQGPRQGEIVWTVTDWAPSVIAPSPVATDDGYVFLTAGYGAGSALLKVRGTDNGFTAERVTDYGPKEGLACEQQTPVLADGFLYGILPKDAGGQRGQFVRAPVTDPRGIQSASGKQVRFGLGPFLRVDEDFLILNDDGTLVFASLTETGYHEHARRNILDGRDAWGPLALVQDRLLLRDDRTLICLKLPMRD
ncbi:MAG: PQQ-binding-like beta-propeller repeat protein [Lentisphaeria bacterium]|nr:PQQ-binding-like beta-propeller repeat protein [Lentisphaeria bacterium]